MMSIRNKLFFELKDLSTYRAELMGWSILWIMMLHFTFTQIKPLGFIAQYGFAGVEIFLFVSGLGLYYSLEKDSHILHFYKKRLIRIFPTYYFIGIFASVLLFEDGFVTYILRYSTIGFWTNGLYFAWYIPAIVALYLIAPLIKRLLDTHPFIIHILALSIIICSYFVAQNQLIDRSHYFLFYRIPAFLYGMYCGRLLLRKEQIAVKHALAIITIGCICFALSYPRHHSIYEFKYYSIQFLLPVFLIVFCILSKCLGRCRFIIVQIGNASLEIFLIQTIFFSAILQEKLLISPAWHDLITLGLIALCSFSGIALHHIIKRVIH